MKKQVDKLNGENRELKEKVKTFYLTLLDQCNECATSMQVRGDQQPKQKV